MATDTPLSHLCALFALISLLAALVYRAEHPGTGVDGYGRFQSLQSGQT